MRTAVLLLILGAVATPAPVLAQSSIRGVELSTTDQQRVRNQCQALRFRMSGSPGTTTPDEPEPGEILSDPAAYWAENANGMDAALARVNLNTLSIRDCRDAGFYD